MRFREVRTPQCDDVKRSEVRKDEVRGDEMR